MEVLKEISFDPKLSSLLNRLRIEKGSRDAEDFEAMTLRVAAVIRPKAGFRIAYVQGRGKDTVDIEGVEFRSRVLCVKLEGVGRVFPYVATCGVEADGLDVPPDDILKQFWLDTLKEEALRCALDRLKIHLKEKYSLKKTASMSPGSGDERLWPIEQKSPSSPCWAIPKA